MFELNFSSTLRLLLENPTELVIARMLIKVKKRMIQGCEKSSVSFVCWSKKLANTFFKYFRDAFAGVSIAVWVHSALHLVVFVGAV